jgi:hypothetical protein
MDDFIQTNDGLKLPLNKVGRLNQLSSLAKELTSQHIESAIEHFNRASGQIDSYTDSTVYDLVVDKRLYPPKAIFGLALSDLLKVSILSSHFSGGDSSECFSILKKLGYSLRPKNGDGLKVYQTYSRREIAAILDPDYEFPSAGGKWSPTGIVLDKPNKGDFVFIVTLNQKSGDDYSYNDYFTEDGCIGWMSQNKHTPEHKEIRAMLNHDESLNTVYLFVRSSVKEDYTYFGP